MSWLRPTVLVAVTVVGAVWTPPASGQDLLAPARDQLRAGHTDSALVLLRAVTDSGRAVPVGTVVEAWVLTGIARYYGGRDSGAAEAFRQAFALDPSARAEGLSAMDSSLGALFEAQRPGATGAASGGDTAVAARDTVYDCRRRCPANMAKPVLDYFPRVNPSDAPASGSQIYPGSGGLGPSGVRGSIEYQFQLTDAGSVDRGTVRIASSNARSWERVFSERLLEARFRPARIEGRPVRVWVRLRVEIEAEGMEGFRYSLKGP